MTSVNRQNAGIAICLTVVLAGVLGVTAIMARIPPIGFESTEAHESAPIVDAGIDSPIGTFAGISHRDDVEPSPRDFCMFSAVHNGLEGEIYVDAVNDAPGDDGCQLYTCSIVYDRNGLRRMFTVEDCGVILNSEGW